MSSKRRQYTHAGPLKRPSNLVRLTQYEITWDPIPDAQPAPWPPEIHEVVARMHDLMETQVSACIPELQQWIERYPDVPILYNYLAAAYSRIGDREQAYQTALANYQRNPNYLFARINYADVCLANGEHEKVAEIFNNTFDLKALYPHRTRFHGTEVVGFMSVIGPFFVAIGSIDVARQVFDVLHQLAPDASGTLRLAAMLLANNR